MVIIVCCDDLKIKRVIIDQGSSFEIIYYDTFERLQLDPCDLRENQDLLIGFLCEHVQVKGYITLKIVFRVEENLKIVKVRYLIIYAFSLYNIIIGTSTFNLLGVSLSTLYLCMKYLLSNENICIVQGDKEIVKRYYQDNLRLKKVMMDVVNAQQPSVQGVNFVNLSPVA